MTSNKQVKGQVEDAYKESHVWFGRRPVANASRGDKRLAVALLGFSGRVSQYGILEMVLGL